MTSQNTGLQEELQAYQNYMRATVLKYKKVIQNLQIQLGQQQGQKSQRAELADGKQADTKLPNIGR